ncbi:MAG: hypothetical protein ACP5UQ_00555 [Anaerolineae bacterium]
MRRFVSIWCAAVLLLTTCGVGSATAGADPIARAVAWLHTQQRPDGAFGRPTANAGLTADVVYALALVGEDPAGPAWTPRGGRSALAALAALAPDYAAADAGQAGKVARAVVLAGGDPRRFAGLDLIAVIRRAYDPMTGRYHPTLLYRHTLALEALLRAGEEVPAAAFQALLRAQLADDGWFWSFDGEQSDVDTTGRVMQVLAGQAGVWDAIAFARAAHYLCRRQLESGGWDIGPRTGPANADSTALAVAGLRAAGYDPQGPAFRKAGRGAVDALLAFQEADGAFAYIRVPGREESRLMATVDALVALAQPLTPPAPNRALARWSPNRWPERLSDWGCYRINTTN